MKIITNERYKELINAETDKQVLKVQLDKLYKEKTKISTMKLEELLQDYEYALIKGKDNRVVRLWNDGHWEYFDSIYLECENIFNSKLTITKE